MPCMLNTALESCAYRHCHIEVVSATKSLFRVQITYTLITMVNICDHVHVFLAFGASDCEFWSVLLILLVIFLTQCIFYQD